MSFSLDSVLSSLGIGSGGSSSLWGTTALRMPSASPSTSLPATSGSDMWWNLGGMVLGAAGKFYLNKTQQRHQETMIRRQSRVMGTSAAFNTAYTGGYYRRLRF